MPAKKKYLSSPGQRVLKITAAIIGGYIVSMSFHLALASWLNIVNVIITMVFSGFTLWVLLMVVAFIAKNGWKIWGVYLMFTLLFSVIIYLGKTYNNPIV